MQLVGVGAEPRRDGAGGRREHAHGVGGDLPPRGQGVDQGVGHGQGAGGVRGLQRIDVGAEPLAADRRHALGEVEVAPLQPANFADAEAKQGLSRHGGADGDEGAPGLACAWLAAGPGRHVELNDLRKGGRQQRRPRHGAMPFQGDAGGLVNHGLNEIQTTGRQA